MELLDENIQSDVYRSMLEMIAKLGLSSYSTTIMTTIILSILLVIILYAIDFLLRKVLLLVLTNFIAKSKTKIDDLLIKNRVLQFATHIVPVIVAKEAIPLIFKGFPNWIKIAMQITDVALLLDCCLMQFLKRSETFFEVINLFRINQLIVICK